MTRRYSQSLSIGDDDISEFRPYESVDDDIALIQRTLSGTAKLASPTIDELVNAFETEPEDHIKHQRSWDFAYAVDRLLETLGRLAINIGFLLTAYDPRRHDGRSRLRRSILRSGPAYQLPSETPGDLVEESKFCGWRMGAVLNIVLLSICLTAEITMLTAATITDRLTSGSGLEGILYHGSCITTKNWTTSLSLLLNVIATLMIGSSNYMMQCLSAPSARELRFAHRNGRSLQLGVSSPMNVVYMSRKKTVLWWTMGVSSIPIHLLFNSAFFSSLQTNNYAIAIMTSDSRNPDLWSNCTDISESMVTDRKWSALVCEIARNMTDATKYEEIDNSECIRRYSEPLVSQYGSLVLLSSTSAARKEAETPNIIPKNMGDPYMTFQGLYGYTEYTKFYDVYSSGDFEESLLDMRGLFGIFTAFEYKDWRNEWRFYKNMSTPTRNGMVDYSDWMCDDDEVEPCSGDAALRNATNWRVTASHIPITGCLSQSTPAKACRLEYSVIILSIVIACDIAKIIAVFFALRIEEPPLITVGDAVASFLRDPEPFTKERCLIDQHRALEESNFFWLLPIDFTPVIGEKGTVADIWPMIFGPLRRPWSRSEKRWRHAASGMRWFWYFFLLSALLAAFGSILGLGIKTLKVSGIDKKDEIWTRGFTEVDPNAMFDFMSSFGENSGGGFLIQVLLVNTAQLLMSFLYFLYNGLFTTMHVAEEWSRLATERKSLRVSDPLPGQRSTYWLNLPWSHSIPLIIVSSLLHWLVARSIYLVRIRAISADGSEQKNSFVSSCGFSTLMTLGVLIVLISMTLLIIGFGFRRLSSRIPLVGTASVAISAACHHPNDPYTEARRPLLWGVTEPAGDGKIGHCSLSSGKVEEPVPGEIYA